MAYSVKLVLGAHACCFHPSYMINLSLANYFPKVTLRADYLHCFHWFGVEGP